MALIHLKLFVDIEGRRLVQSDASDADVSLPSLVQGDTVNLEIYLLLRTKYYPAAVGGNLPYSRISPSGISLRVGIGTPTSSASGSPPPIYQTTFTQDTNLNCFRGLLTLSRNAVATMLNGALAKAFTFEIEANDGSSLSTVYQGDVTIHGDLLKEGAPEEPPPVEDRYLTQADANSLYVRKSGEGSIMLVSPDGTKKLLLWLDNSGVLQTSLIND